MSDIFLLIIVLFVILIIPGITGLFPLYITIGSLILQSILIIISGIGIFYNFKNDRIESIIMLLILADLILIFYTSMMNLFQQYNI